MVHGNTLSKSIVASISSDLKLLAIKITTMVTQVEYSGQWSRARLGTRVSEVGPKRNVAGRGPMWRFATSATRKWLIRAKMRKGVRSEEKRTKVWAPDRMKEIVPSSGHVGLDARQSQGWRPLQLTAFVFPHPAPSKAKLSGEWCPVCELWRRILKTTLTYKVVIQCSKAKKTFWRDVRVSCDVGF